MDQSLAVLKAPKVWGALHGGETVFFFFFFQADSVFIALFMPAHTILFFFLFFVFFCAMFPEIFPLGLETFSQLVYEDDYGVVR